MFFRFFDLTSYVFALGEVADFEALTLNLALNPLFFQTAVRGCDLFMFN